MGTGNTQEPGKTDLHNLNLFRIELGCYIDACALDHHFHMSLDMRCRKSRNPTGHQYRLYCEKKKHASCLNWKIILYTRIWYIAINFLFLHLRMQTMSWQDWLDVEDPAHVEPLPWGDGLVHVRLRVWVPGPHVTEHAPQLPQVAQPPFTAGNYRQ